MEPNSSKIRASSCVLKYKHTYQKLITDVAKDLSKYIADKYKVKVVMKDGLVIVSGDVSRSVQVSAEQELTDLLCEASNALDRLAVDTQTSAFTISGR